MVSQHRSHRRFHAGRQQCGRNTCRTHTECTGLFICLCHFPKHGVNHKCVWLVASKWVFVAMLLRMHTAQPCSFTALSSSHPSQLVRNIGHLFVVDCHLEACAWSFSPPTHFTVLSLVLLGHHCCSSLFHRAASFPCFCPSLPVHQSLNVAFAWSNDLMLCCDFVASLTSTNLIFDHADIVADVVQPRAFHRPAAACMFRDRGNIMCISTQQRQLFVSGQFCNNHADFV